jgi:hypothetical protein
MKTLSKYVEQIPKDINVLYVTLGNDDPTQGVSIDRRTFQRALCLEHLVDELITDRLDDYDFMDNHRLDVEEIAREQASDAIDEDALRDRIVGMLDTGDFDYQLEKAVKKVLKEVADGFANS